MLGDWSHNGALQSASFLMLQSTADELAAHAVDGAAVDVPALRVRSEMRQAVNRHL
jgi:hypothetical protein